MAEILFPKRQRCLNCRKKFGNIVLDGLYCSYNCASKPQPYKDIELAPRGCKLERDGKWIWKQRYRYTGEVPERLKNDPATNIYLCEHCRMFHVGHSRAIGTETIRLINDLETLGSFLLRFREQSGRNKKYVADKIKTRVIRITEIESGSKESDIEIIFKLLKFYKIKLQFLF